MLAQCWAAPFNRLPPVSVTVEAPLATLASSSPGFDDADDAGEANGPTVTSAPADVRRISTERPRTRSPGDTRVSFSESDRAFLGHSAMRRVSADAA